MNLTLDRWFPSWTSLSVHESSPSDDFIRRFSDAYSCSHFFKGVPLGDSQHGVRCENLEQLTFSDDTFDLFITQDVLEHVFRPELAVREIMRVLKPGAAHVFTTPKYQDLRATRQRATVRGEEVVHLLDPVYHDNPLGDGSLVTWDYGDDFETLIWRWCGFPTVTYVTRDRAFGLDGEFLEVFVTRKLRSAFPGD